MITNKQIVERKNYSRWHCRCKTCNARFVLKKHPEDYKRKRKCEWCNGELKIDYYRQAKGANEGRKTCYCDGYYFPHRKSSKWCCHYKGILTDDDFRERGYQ